MRAIITDLDRTLLYTDKSVSQYTVDVLKKCHDRNIYVFAASARPLRDIKLYDDLIGFDAIVATNGAVIEIGDCKVEFGISCESGEQMLSNILEFPDVVLSIETNKGLYSNQDIPIWNPVVYDKFPKLPNDIILYKILASSERSVLYEGIDKILTEDVYHTIANNELIQIMSCNAAKWSGISHILSVFDILPSEVVYFGDDNDDIEPLKKCGLGVAVSNAISAVLDVANQIADSNDKDGVAKYIEEKILCK